MGDGKGRFVPVGMFQKREKSFKNKVLWRTGVEGSPYIGTAVTGAATARVGRLSRGRRRCGCLNLCAPRGTRLSSAENGRGEKTDLREERGCHYPMRCRRRASQVILFPFLGSSPLKSPPWILRRGLPQALLKPSLPASSSAPPVLPLEPLP